jgi:predicted TIM-barrel fold metal-dependent hydrolase
MPTDDHVRPLLDFASQAGWPVMFHTGTYIYSDVLALAEAARLYPDLNFIAGFGGFTDMWFELPGAFAEVPNLYLDASMMWGGAIAQIVAEQGAGRVLYGSAEPRGRYAAGMQTVLEIGLSKEQQRAIFRDNAMRLFGIS